MGRGIGDRHGGIMKYNGAQVIYFSMNVVQKILRHAFRYPLDDGRIEDVGERVVLAADLTLSPKWH